MFREKTQMLHKSIGMLLALILLLQISPIQIFAAVSRIYKVELELYGTAWSKTVTDSCIFYTSASEAVVKKGTISMSDDINDIQWKFTNTRTGKVVKNGSGINIPEFNLPADIVYEVSVWSLSKSVRRDYTIDVKYAKAATTGIRYRTNSFVCTNIDGNFMPASTYVATLDGGDIPGADRKKMATWPNIKHDGQTRMLNGFGLVTVYHDGVPKKGPFSTYAGDGGSAFSGYPQELTKLEKAEYWSAATLGAFKSLQHIQLSYTSPFFSQVIIQKTYEGPAAPPPETIDSRKDSNTDNDYIFPDTNIPYEYNCIPAEGWEVDTTKSKLYKAAIYPGDATTIVNKPAYFVRNLTDADVKGSVNLNMDEFLYNFTFVYKPKDILSGQFKLNAKPDELTIVETEYIGKYAQIDIDIKQDSTNIAEWYKILDRGNLKAALSITRNPGGAIITTVSSPIPATGAATTLNKTQLLDLFKGNTKLSFKDDLLNYPIPENTTKKFTYTATLTISVNGVSKAFTGKPASDSVTFYRPPNPNNKGYFMSTPKYWSEIKEGSPLNETFEAMAGVPTTRNLYFASGGSEFIVDIETEYVSDKTTTRNYRDTFTAVRCDVVSPCTPHCHGHTSGDPPTTTYCGSCCHCGCGHNADCRAHYVSDSWSWSQTINYDYTKINNLKVWKLDRSKVDGLYQLIGTDEVTATVQAGDPTVFWNIDNSNTSSGGRIRYSLNTAQHDSASWTQASNNSCTGHTAANMAVMNGHKALQNQGTVVSDFAILQTTKGDQAVMYYQAQSNSARTDAPLLVPKTSKETQWDSNSNSAANWDELNTIAVGSYNGNYFSPSTKYENKSGGTITTIFDSMSAGMSRPGRPSSGMRLWVGGLDIKNTIPNKEYITGLSSVFYTNIINYGAGAPKYSLSYDSDYGLNGQQFYSTYSPNHAKINDIVVHNPVSTEYAMIYSLPQDRDQRSSGSAIGEARQGGTTCPCNPADCEFRILDCHYAGGTSHTAACYTTVNVTGPNNSHVHNGSCSVSTVDKYLCGITPVATYSYNWYHPDCGSFMNSGPNPDYCSCCGSYGYSSGSPTVTWNHQHTAACGLIPAGSWSCNNMPLNTHVHNASCGCMNATVLNCMEPHHSGVHYDVGNGTCYRACMDNAKHAAKATIIVPGQGTFSPGKFINLDYSFTLYFPNKGDFYGNGALGLSSTSAIEGKGFTTPMDTTEWTKEKSVYFDFNVILGGVMYRAGEKIPLDVNSDTFVFYCPLGNHEKKDANVRYECLAINTQQSFVDNSKMNNKLRDGSLRAKHSGIKNTTIDVVGRIGNFVIEDTGDFRFANLFKAAKVPTEWIVQNVVPQVNANIQNKIIGYQYDIRGLPADGSTNYLNTYGILPHKQQQPIPFPLSPEKNNIPQLQKQPLRIGYRTLADVETIGDYYRNMQIIFYYYKLDLLTKAITPVDVYMNVDGEYKPINIYGAAVPGWDPYSVYNNYARLSWDDEAARRNYSLEEKLTSELIYNTTGLNIPAGRNYAYGNNQIQFPTERNRTFIGSTATYESDMNPGNRVSELLYFQQAQRWHFTYGLPSSAIFVRHGAQPTQANIDAVMNDNSVILTAADILAVGEVFNLQYEFEEGNQPIVISGVVYPTTSIPYPVIQATSANKSSALDLGTSGTH